MREPRALASLVRVGANHPRLLVFGGQSGSSILGTSEWYDQEGDEWSEGPTLEKGRKSFAALMAPVELACTLTGTDPPPHSCPALGNTPDCLFLSTSGLVLHTRSTGM